MCNCIYGIEFIVDIYMYIDKYFNVVYIFIYINTVACMHKLMCV